MDPHNEKPTPASATSSGGSTDPDELLPLLYEELRRLAQRFLERHGPGHTLQPTALVHEAFVRLSAAERPPAFENRQHFFRVAARAMRGVLVNHAQAKNSLKRGGDHGRVTLQDVDARTDDDVLDLLALDQALDELARENEELARIVELRFFAGLTIEQSAEALSISTATVERRWRLARAFLRQAMRGAGETDA